ncbi:serine/threonine-protein kinase [Streptomyces kanamyceticus]|uniref:non-specific serine/threonine protein kinase n=1 Tax=Streptomyces kanamyceticus TaxID=1967 RepID=Q1EQK1_STRKN|nr:serine/threonine-protein kinase [Streptomyces kanamyceticus]BAE95519.1 putative serine/threonine protein kinase [Streptomyces kanamyceticus]
MADQLLGDRYRLLRQLGEGGMGQVWEARDETLGRLVAVKLIAMLAGGNNKGDEARARFLREARITAALHHPNVVTVHDLGQANGENGTAPFLVMELLRGEALDALVRRGPVSLPDAARWGAQICDALADAHEAGVLHRDIKPSNVLITATGRVKVLDFGIARAADPYATANRLTQTGFIVGTPPYMAPEQARGFPESRSDLYALGCLLFELITGRLPFQAPDAVGYLTAHLTQPPPAPSSVAAHIPSDWDELVLTLLRKEPEQRYATAADVSDALRRLESGRRPGPGAMGAPTATRASLGATARLGAAGSEPEQGRKPAAIPSALPRVGFELVRRGYDREEVDVYLSLPADERGPIPSFNLVRHGYDCDQVDEYLGRVRVTTADPGTKEEGDADSRRPVGFELVRRGYDREEVDAYLSLPADERGPIPAFNLRRRGYHRGQVDTYLGR